MLVLLSQLVVLLMLRFSQLLVMLQLLPVLFSQLLLLLLHTVLLS